MERAGCVPGGVVVCSSAHRGDANDLDPPDDELFDWSDNARLLELRLQQAGVPVRNEIYAIGHHYTDEVYELIMLVQP